MRWLSCALALLGIGLCLALLRIGRQPASPPAFALPSSVLVPAVAGLPIPVPVPSPSARFRGDVGSAGERARAALARVLATGMGARARQVMESGALPETLTIEVNDRGDQFTRYRVPGRELSETIVFDPDRLPLVETEAGPLRALPETVLAHELGHAVFKLVSEQEVIHSVENPVREALGLPRRRF